MKEKILLDTSVIRSISSNRLTSFVKRYSVFSSPYSFWEILCHLIESKNFDYFRHHLCKFKYLSILDDPFGIIAKHTKTFQSTMNDRICDEELIHGIVTILESSISIQDFYSNTFTDSRGQTHKIFECAERSHRILDKASERFQKFVQDIIKTVNGNQLKYKTRSERHELILQLIGGWERRLEEKGGDTDRLRRCLQNEVYVYFSHVLNSATTYLDTNKNIDPNDYEDTQICLHLQPDSNFVLITDDNGLYDSITRTITQLNEIEFENVTLRIAKSDYLGSFKD